MISEHLSERSQKALLNIMSDDEDFVYEVGLVVFILRTVQELDIAEEHNISRKEIRKKLDTLERAINAVPEFVKCSIPGIHQVHKRIQEPLENEIASDRRPCSMAHL